jgi:glycosyltransferase involved in cell wall biosynthesis
MRGLRRSHSGDQGKLTSERLCNGTNSSPVGRGNDLHDGKTPVLRVITRLNVGGPARHAILLTRDLDEHGFRSELIYGSVTEGEGMIEPTRVRATFLPDLQRPVSPAADLRAARALSREIRARRPVIVHTHLAKAGTLGRLVAHRSRVPLIIHTFHGHVFEGYFSPSVAQAFVAIERGLARWTDAFIAISPRIRDEILALGVGRPSQWHVVPLGLELDPIIRATVTRAEARRRLGLDPDYPVVGVVGRLVPIKDHSTFLMAAADLLKSRPDVMFVIAGDGELRASIESEAKRLLRDRVRFLGWVQDLAGLYAALDLVVLTSRNEGTPVALIEAGAAGKAVVATSVGGVPDVVRDGTTGLLAPAGDPRAVAMQIAALLDDYSRAAAMGRAGREWVRDRYSVQRLVADTASLYRELLARKGFTMRGEELST